MHTLGVLLFIVAGITTWATLITISTAKAGVAIASFIINGACIVVELVAAMQLIHA